MKKTPVKSEGIRDNRIDNVRFILIVLVVCGHLLELIPGTSAAYKFIYSFHMPVFIYITGYFAKFDVKKYLMKLVMPYIAFQILYLVFDGIVLKDSKPKIQFTTPYWLLWYIFAIIVYYLLVPILAKLESNILIGIIILSFALGLYIGNIDKAGYYLSISRIIVFLPFFLLGYYCKRTGFDRKIAESLKSELVGIRAIVLAVVGSIAIVKAEIPVRMLYGSYSYTEGKGAMWMRLTIYIVAILWIMVLCGSVTNKKLPCITAIGQNTMPVYLLHGFVIKLLKKYKVFHYGLTENIVIMLLVAIAIVFVLGCLRIKKESISRIITK